MIPRRLPAGALLPAALFAAAVAVLPLPAIGQAPAGTGSTRYCMRLEVATGSLVEPVRCSTRAQWEAQGVDLDADWPREGIRIIG